MDVVLVSILQVDLLIFLPATTAPSPVKYSGLDSSVGANISASRQNLSVTVPELSG